MSEQTPKPSEPTPDEGTAKLTMPAMITEAECNRRVEDAKPIRVAWGMEHK